MDKYVIVIGIFTFIYTMYVPQALLIIFSITIPIYMTCLVSASYILINILEIDQILYNITAKLTKNNDYITENEIYLDDIMNVFKLNNKIILHSNEYQPLRKHIKKYWIATLEYNGDLIYLNTTLYKHDEIINIKVRYNTINDLWNSLKEEIHNKTNNGYQIT